MVHVIFNWRSTPPSRACSGHPLRPSRPRFAFWSCLAVIHLYCSVSLRTLDAGRAQCDPSLLQIPPAGVFVSHTPYTEHILCSTSIRPLCHHHANLQKEDLVLHLTDSLALCPPSSFTIAARWPPPLFSCILLFSFSTGRNRAPQQIRLV